ncbi:MAG: prepilin-type N-terminal cleavage/methylation domain-containing protein [Kiritimatiellae bacterium]|nr:prepilin-type N-terminal cleavage/methylation domain-containing protein [Kiritimatiellia bacterium]
MGKIMRSERNGFTMIELMLVVAIIGIVTTITVPNLIRSSRGNRLRMAARSIVMAGRYARSMAVMNGKDLSLVFDIGAGEVSVPGEMKRKLDKVRIEHVELMGGARNPFAISSGEHGSVFDALGLATDKDNEDSMRTEGKIVIVYRNNGRCDPYNIRIVDENDQAIEIHVDMLASVKTTAGGAR